MEKYKPFTDAKTGINPYIPFQDRQLTRTAAALGLALLPFRIVLVVTSLLLLLVAGLLQWLLRLMGLSNLCKFTVTLLYANFLQVFLLFLGNIWVSSHAYPTRPNKNAVQFGSVGDNVRNPRPGDTMLVNLQSAFDPLVLCVLWPTVEFVFAFTSLDGTKRFFSAWQAFFFILKGCNIAPDRANGDKAEEHFQQSSKSSLDLNLLQAEARRCSRVLVMFPEGTTTNGRGILQFPAIMNTQELHLCTLLHPSNTPHNHSVPSGVVQDIWKSLLYPSLYLWTIHGITCRPSATPAPSQLMSISWSDDVRAKMCQSTTVVCGNGIVPLKPLGSNYSSKYRFLELWYATTKGVGGVKSKKND